MVKNAEAQDSLFRIVLAALLHNEVAVWDVRMSQLEHVSESRISQILHGQSIPSSKQLGKVMELLQQPARRRARPRPQVVAVQSYLHERCVQIRKKTPRDEQVEAVRKLLNMVHRWSSAEYQRAPPPDDLRVGTLPLDTAEKWIGKANAIICDDSFKAMLSALDRFCCAVLVGGDLEGVAPRRMRAYPQMDPRVGVRDVVVHAPFAAPVSARKKDTQVDPWEFPWVWLGEAENATLSRPESIVGSILANIEAVVAKLAFEMPRDGVARKAESAFLEALERSARLLITRKALRKIEEETEEETEDEGKTGAKLTRLPDDPNEWTEQDIVHVVSVLKGRICGPAVAADARTCTETLLAVELRLDPLAEFAHRVLQIHKALADGASFASLEVLRDNLVDLRDALGVVFEPGGAEARDKKVAQWLSVVFPGDPEPAHDPSLVLKILGLAKKTSRERDYVLRLLLDDSAGTRATEVADEDLLRSQESVRLLLRRRAAPPLTDDEQSVLARVAEDLRALHGWVGRELAGDDGEAPLPAYRESRSVLHPGQVFAVRTGLDVLLDKTTERSRRLFYVAANDGDPWIPVRQAVLQRGIEAELRTYLEKFVLAKCFVP